MDLLRIVSRVAAGPDWRSNPPSGWDEDGPMPMTVTETGLSFDYEALPDGSTKVWGWDSYERPFEGVLGADGTATFSEGSVDGFDLKEYVLPHVQAGL